MPRPYGTAASQLVYGAPAREEVGGEALSERQVADDRDLRASVAPWGFVEADGVFEPGRAKGAGLTQRGGRIPGPCDPPPHSIQQAGRAVHYIRLRRLQATKIGVSERYIRWGSYS
jgi:hypothetical protein